MKTTRENNKVRVSEVVAHGRRHRPPARRVGACACGARPPCRRAPPPPACATPRPRGDLMAALPLRQRPAATRGSWRRGGTRRRRGGPVDAQRQRGAPTRTQPPPPAAPTGASRQPAAESTEASPHHHRSTGEQMKCACEWAALQQPAAAAAVQEARGRRGPLIRGRARHTGHTLRPARRLLPLIPSSRLKPVPVRA